MCLYLCLYESIGLYLCLCLASTSVLISISSIYIYLCFYPVFKCFLLFLRLFLQLLVVPVAVKQLYKFDIDSYFLFILCVTFCDCSHETIASANVKKSFPSFLLGISSSGLMVKSSELIFAYGVRYGLLLLGYLCTCECPLFPGPFTEERTFLIDC